MRLRRVRSRTQSNRYRCFEPYPQITEHGGELTDSEGKRQIDGQRCSEGTGEARCRHLGSADLTRARLSGTVEAELTAAAAAGRARRMASGWPRGKAAQARTVGTGQQSRATEVLMRGGLAAALQRPQ